MDEEVKVVSEPIEEVKRPRVIMVATPSLDGRVDVQYANSLLSTTIECWKNNTAIAPVFIAYDALIQRARNDLFKMAYESDIDEVVFIDGDISWTPEQFMKLISHNVDVVGGAYRKKSFQEEYVVRVLPGETKLKVNKDKLVEVSGLGTGFVRVSKKVIQEVYESSKDYKQGDKKSKMVFDIQIAEDGELLSEDIVFSEKIRSLGYNIYLDPYITCGHTGPVPFYGDLVKWANINNLIEFE